MPMLLMLLLLLLLLLQMLFSERGWVVGGGQNSIQSNLDVAAKWVVPRVVPRVQVVGSAPECYGPHNTAVELLEQPP